MAVRRVGEGVSSVRVRGARRWGEAVAVAREGRRLGVVEAVRMVWRKVEEVVVAVREARCLGLGEREQAMLMEVVVEEPCQMAFGRGRWYGRLLANRRRWFGLPAYARGQRAHGFERRPRAWNRRWCWRGSPWWRRRSAWGFRSGASWRYGRGAACCLWV